MHKLINGNMVVIAVLHRMWHSAATAPGLPQVPVHVEVGSGLVWAWAGMRGIACMRRPLAVQYRYRGASDTIKP